MMEEKGIASEERENREFLKNDGNNNLNEIFMVAMDEARSLTEESALGGK